MVNELEHTEQVFKWFTSKLHVTSLTLLSEIECTIIDLSLFYQNSTESADFDSLKSLYYLETLFKKPIYDKVDA